jgi:hypothetical protein
MRGFLGRSLRIAAIVAAGLAWTSKADASPITYAFSGTITSADASTGVSAGTPFSGTFTYDPTEKISGGLGFEGYSQIDYGQSMSYPGSKPDGSGLTVNVGNSQVFNLQGGIEVAISEAAYPYQDGYSTSAHSQVTFSNSNINNVTGSTLASVSFVNQAADVLGSLGAPTSLNLADFPGASLSVVGDSGSPDATILYAGTITSLSAVPVPEPSALAVIGLGGAAWVARTRRRTACDHRARCG